MPYSYDLEPGPGPSRLYSRSRSAAKGSTDSTKSRERAGRPPSQKAMLSRALQKANTAVQLDNAGNIKGARQAYAEACELLHHVLQKTPGEDDRRKLDAIRVTYTTRIEELDMLAPMQQQDNRPLPHRPQSSNDSLSRSFSDSPAVPSGENDDLSDPGAEDDNGAVLKIAALTRIYPDLDDEPVIKEDSRLFPAYPFLPISTSAPELQQQSYAGPRNDGLRHGSSLLTDQYTLQSSFSRSSHSKPNGFNSSFGNSTGAAIALAISTATSTAALQLPTTSGHYIPPPLSPRRIPSPTRLEAGPGSNTYGTYGSSDPITSSIHRPEVRSASVLSNGHAREVSHESVSWLDPIDESGSEESDVSSVHSRSSSMRLRRKHIRAASGATEAEFDAALDDAIEAAYDDGYEPMSSPISMRTHMYDDDDNVDDENNDGSGEDVLAQAMRKVELAKERARESEREALALERQLHLKQQQQQQRKLRKQQRKQQLRQQQLQKADFSSRGNFLDPPNDSEDEEHILGEMTTGYAIEDFALNPTISAKLGMPRGFDSSEFANRTWHSSLASNPLHTASTALSTLTENTIVPPALTSKLPPAMMAPPPTQALPELPPLSRPSTAHTQNPVRGGSASVSGDDGAGVRSRRLSGQNMKQLKIQTTKLSPPMGAAASSGMVAPHMSCQTTLAVAVSMSATAAHPPRSGGFLAQQRQTLSAGPAGPVGSTGPGRPGSSAAGPLLPFSRGISPATATTSWGSSPNDIYPATPPIPQGIASASPFFDNESIVGRAGSPSSSNINNNNSNGHNSKPALRKNFSSSSLKSLRSRNLSVSNLDDGSDMSPGTPLSSQFMLNARLPAMPSLPTPLVTAFKERIGAGSSTGGMHLLESDFHSPTTPGSPNPMYTDAPIPLEPCPTDTLLRPFWLMRCLYQTLVHPRGGYLSNKLFVPSDVWKVKGVKLKNVDEKIANCDLLTAALLKLARVDTNYADDVLDEMQSLEGVLEQVQSVLARRLGNEVGLQSAGSLFKEASIPLDSETANSAVPRTASVSGKSSFSWRRLRSKNSSAGLGSGYLATGRKESVSEVSAAASGGGGSLASLPMTPHPTSKPAKRDVTCAKFNGPNANYMSSLARLFDASQAIDQIARQVEDPGLRHADKTQVGLELCTRHASEFFAFYICRFVLSDVSLLLEKFIKRGSEWVLA